MNAWTYSTSMRVMKCRSVLPSKVMIFNNSNEMKFWNINLSFFKVWPLCQEIQLHKAIGAVRNIGFNSLLCQKLFSKEIPSLGLRCAMFLLLLAFPLQPLIQQPTGHGWNPRAVLVVSLRHIKGHQCFKRWSIKCVYRAVYEFNKFSKSDLIAMATAQCGNIETPLLTTTTDYNVLVLPL